MVPHLALQKERPLVPRSVPQTAVPKEPQLALQLVPRSAALMVLQLAVPKERRLGPRSVLVLGRLQAPSSPQIRSDQRRLPSLSGQR